MFNISISGKTKLFTLIIKSKSFLTQRQSGVSTRLANATQNSPADYCLQCVRRYDYENFLCTLLLPSAARRCAFAVRAFNAEVARVQSNVSDARLGQARIRFWQDSVDMMYGPQKERLPDNPVVQELNEAVKQHKLTKSYLKRLLSSRELRLLQTSCLTTEDLSRYCEDSVSCVYFLVLEGCGIRDIHADHAASHLGKAQGIVNMLRSLSLASEPRSVFLPQKILMKHGVSQEGLLRQQDSKGIRDVIFDVASEANYHLEKARELQARVPSSARQALLPACAVGHYLERLRKVDFRVFEPSLRTRNHILPIVLYWNKLRRKY